METETTVINSVHASAESEAKAGQASDRKSPVMLLLRVHLLQARLRMAAIREQSKLLSGAIMGFMACYLIFLTGKVKVNANKIYMVRLIVY